MPGSYQTRNESNRLLGRSGSGSIEDRGAGAARAKR